MMQSRDWNANSQAPEVKPLAPMLYPVYIQNFLTARSGQQWDQLLGV